MFSNQFDVGIVYVFKVGMIWITLKKLFISNNIFFFKFFILSFLQAFYYLHFSLNLQYFFHSFLKLAKLRSLKLKKHVGWVGLGWGVAGV
jgi:hypothetical protein